jgi:hypothetical protein
MAGMPCPEYGFREEWFHPDAPGREHGVPLFFGRKYSEENLVRAEGVEPSRAVNSRDRTYFGACSDRLPEFISGFSVM